MGLDLRNRDMGANLRNFIRNRQMSARERVRRYRSQGAAAGMARVEVLVPPSARGEILAVAARLRFEHRRANELNRLCERALSSYRTRILDNVDLDRLPDARAKASVIARAMMDRGDARAFMLGRKMLAHIGAS